MMAIFAYRYNAVRLAARKYAWFLPMLTTIATKLEGRRDVDEFGNRSTRRSTVKRPSTLRKESKISPAESVTPDFDTVRAVEARSAFLPLSCRVPPVRSPYCCCVALA
jgi:hypothetical protein